ncbi:MAG: BTAD domain-containing putative transcriptional regulator [Chloroflexota bacterium]
MTLDTVIGEIYDTFHAYVEDSRLILLHPDSRYRTALVSRLIVDDKLPVYYYAMSTDDIDVPTFIAGFTHDLAEQVPTFGAAINMVGLDNLQDLVPLLEAFAEDLNNLTSEPFLLLLDEFDRAEIGDDLQRFFEALVDYLPPQTRLVISGRNLPRFPWMSLIAQSKAVMLRDNELISGDFYQNQAGENARVKITGLGPGTVEVDNETIENWEGHLPRLLFFFALDRPVVTRSEICQAFWPELSTDQAVNVFHVTKRRLHKAIEALGVDALIHENGSYHVNPQLSIHYDITEFVGALVEARLTTSENRGAAWQRVIDLYHRPFLQGHNEPWIAKRRQEYQAGYLEALTEMAHMRLQDDRPEHALALLQQALKENPRRQDIHREVMSLYAQLGRRSEAASHYQKLQEILADQHIPLQPETQQLYKDLMSS